MAIIWISSGIALGFVLLYGLRVIPAVLISSFIINFLLYSHGFDQLDRQIYLFSIALSVGAGLQAWIGHACIKKYITLDNLFTTPKDIILFIFVAGPVVGLIYPTWSIVMMDIWHSSYTLSFTMDWITWWLLNSISLLLLTPVCLAIGRRHDSMWRSRLVFIVMPLFVIYSVITLLYDLTARSNQRRISVQLDKMITQKKRLLERQIQSTRFLVKSMRAYFSASQLVDRKEFKTFSSLLMRGNPAVFAFGWATQSMAPQKDYKIKYMEVSDRYQQEVNQPHLEVLLLKYISQMNLTQSRPFLSRPFKLLNNDHAMSIAYLNPPNRASKLQGIAIAAIDLSSMLKHEFKSSKIIADVTVMDITNIDAPIIIFKNEGDKNLLMSNQPISIEKKFRMDDVNRIWLFKAQASRSFMIQYMNLSQWFVLVSGLLFSILTTALLFILYGQRQVVNLEVEEQTHKLREEMAKNALILETAGEGIIGIDQAGSVTFVNQAALSFLGYQEQNIVGQDYFGLCQPVDQFQGERPKQTLDVYKTLHDGQVRDVEEDVLLKADKTMLWVDLTIRPMRQGSDVVGVVVVFSDVTQRREDHQKLDRMAHYDALTNLPNRESFFHHVEQLIKTAERDKSQFLVCFIDIDNFKLVNDSVGHEVGDHLIQYIADQLHQLVPYPGYLARLGGDEFGLVLVSNQSMGQLVNLIRKLLSRFDVAVEIDGYEIKTSISIGIAIYPAAGKNSQVLIKNADVAMYRAKSHGRNTYAFFNESIEQQVSRYNEVQTALYGAVGREEFQLVYQPIVSMKSNKPVGVEVLIRWNGKQSINSSPSEFILIAEECGLIHEIGEWAFKEMAGNYSQLAAALSTLYISINVSVRQFEKKRFMEMVKHELALHHIPADKILIEVTETAVMRDPEVSIKVMEQLSQLGLQFSLDDFGTGYSSMNYLRSLPIKYIKIDKSFVDGIEESKHDSAIIDATIRLAGALEFYVIAEGVETVSQRDWLREVGCDYAQGYFYAKPMDLPTFLTWLKDQA